jgi:hypothetical protein
MRPILLGCAAAALFVGGVMMAPLTSDLAVSPCPAGELSNSALSCATSNTTVGSVFAR